VDGYEAVMRFDVALEGFALGVGGEGFVVAVGEDDGGVLVEVGVGEGFGCVGGVDGEVALAPIFLMASTLVAMLSWT
jgi:hypothetical protein